MDTQAAVRSCKDHDGRTRVPLDKMTIDILKIVEPKKQKFQEMYFFKKLKIKIKM